MIQNDEELLYSLSLRLDAPHRVIKNHEHLASKLGVSADVRARCKLNTTYNPTKQLLELLDAEKPQLTVADIIYALQQIHRNDVVNIIEDALPGKKNRTQWNFILQYLFIVPVLKWDCTLELLHFHGL